MVPEYYADIRLAGKFLPYNASRVIRRLHELIAQHPDTYALTFPHMKTGNLSGELPEIGNVVRVFASNREAVDLALDHLEIGLNGKESSSHGLQVGRVRPVPDNHDGAWVSYQRFRIPARRGKSEQHQEKRSRLRMKRLQEAKLLPYFILDSASTRQTFSLIVNPVWRDTKPDHSVEHCDGYGLSSNEHPVWLPDLT